MTATQSKIGQVFAASRSKNATGGRLELMPFVPAGYPSLEATAAVLPAISKAGAGLIEVGIPFSDPIADGPVIQAAFTHALGQGVKVGGVLDVVRSVRKDVACPVVGMVSYSIVFRRGVEAFAAQCREAGFDGLIIPDLPAPEARGVSATLAKAGLDSVLLVAPSTSAQRRREIAELSTGFIYYLSVSGITGERSSLPPDLVAGLADMRRLTDKPLCVGFGLSTRQHLAALKDHADGAIVGSALVKRMRAHGDAPSAVAKAAADFCHELLA